MLFILRAIADSLCSIAMINKRGLGGVIAPFVLLSHLMSWLMLAASAMYKRGTPVVAGDDGAAVIPVADLEGEESTSASVAADNPLPTPPLPAGGIAGGIQNKQVAGPNDDTDETTDSSDSAQATDSGSSDKEGSGSALQPLSISVGAACIALAYGFA